MAQRGSAFPTDYLGRERYQKMSIGDLLRKFEALREQDEPFDPDYPIIHL